MKKLIYLASLLMAFAFASCEDFLTVQSPDKLTTDKFWRDGKDAEAGMAASYGALYLGNVWSTSENRWPVEEFRTDLFDMGKDARTYSYWTSLYYFTYDNSNPSIAAYFSGYYRGLNFTNQVLYNVPNIPEGEISEEKRTELVSEAHFLRGYYHLMLLLNWEKIILRDELGTTENLNKPLSERVECWNFIVDELATAATGLPQTRPETETGRATSGAANAYLGFAYLTRAYEEPAQKDEFLGKALEALNKVEGYELVKGKDLIDMFNGRNKNCPESVFEVQYTKNSANDSKHYSYFQLFIAAKEMGGWDEILPNEKLMNEYMKEGEVASTGRYDSRLYNNIYYQCDYFNDGTGKVMGKDYDWWFVSERDENNEPVGPAYNRPSFRRYTPREASEMDEICGFNAPLMRYANVLLMKAEVLNLQGKTAEAIEIINHIRDVHGDMPAMTGTSQEEVQAQIEHERILEFPLESYRWYDLRRWGKTAQVMKEAGRENYDDSQHRFFPIPIEEITSNPALGE